MKIGAGEVLSKGEILRISFKSNLVFLDGIRPEALHAKFYCSVVMLKRISRIRSSEVDSATTTSSMAATRLGYGMTGADKSSARYQAKRNRKADHSVGSESG
jgi:hypothetical protein